MRISYEVVQYSFWFPYLFLFSFCLMNNLLLFTLMIGTILSNPFILTQMALLLECCSEWVLGFVHFISYWAAKHWVTWEKCGINWMNLFRMKPRGTICSFIRIFIRTKTFNPLDSNHQECRHRRYYTLNEEINITRGDHITGGVFLIKWTWNWTRSWLSCSDAHVDSPNSKLWRVHLHFATLLFYAT